MMARGLILSFSAQTAMFTIPNGFIPRLPLPISKISFVSPSHRGRRLRLSVPSPRLFCNCASSTHHTVDMKTYNEAFSNRMAMAGLKPHHRIAMGVSGGPDSVALCVLTAHWKTQGLNASYGNGEFIEGLLAIIVDHGLRAESQEEANTVSNRLSKMGIRCEIADCDWPDGRPKQGHLQEAAREMRYQKFQKVCSQNQIGVLLIAHHADDQAELFVLRLSRNSGVLGLAGMPFTSQIFSSYTHSYDEVSKNDGILLVRPLLDFYKEDMYKICQGGNQDWVEDPTNQSLLYVRNRIRMSLRDSSSSRFKSELQAVISSCQKTRVYVDHICSNLISKAVTIMDLGYAVMDLEILNESKIDDVCLSRFIALVLQFISQRHRPIRGSTSKLLLDYLHTFPCKTSLTAGGCYLCPAPASKGTKALVCCSVNCPRPSTMELFDAHPYAKTKNHSPNDIEQIIADGKSYANHLIPDASDVHFLDITSGSVLTEAKKLNLLSESTYKNILLLQSEEVKKFRSKTTAAIEFESNGGVKSASTYWSGPLLPGKICSFMNRFFLIWDASQKPNFLRDIIARALQALPVIFDPIPKGIIQDFKLLSLHEAYAGIHQPKNINEADMARKRLIFDEFFYLQLGRLFQMLEGLGTQIEKDGLLDKYRKPEINAAYIEGWSCLAKTFLKSLPYSLTSSQLSAVSEIIWDLRQPVPMNRLLQGDVGCGKTIVAFLACMEVIGSGYQAAFMVPTELLAFQHYEQLSNLLENMEEIECKPSIALLTGSTPLRQSRMIRKDLQTGDISMVIGTHSLIAENVEFSALRIAVVDEQHRFGVIQRGRFNSKLFNTSISSTIATTDSDETSKVDNYMAPHVLAMSATPIPRTLALALYGDVSLTQITDLPPGRIPVETLIIEGSDNGFQNVYKIMLDELQAGGKVYLVYPVIEQSEQLPQLRAASADFESISDKFQDYSCGLLHGKMKGDEKDEALRRFRSGETQILLATQVIEIGVDVPDASLMVVMNAERFGIAQLHQLRGRVGRGVKKSKCIFIASTASSLNRLKVLEKSSDGFHLANVDLLLRGPGDLLGKKQSGHLPEFPIARLEVDGNILQEAHLAALKVLSASHDMEQFPLLKAELSMRQPLSLLGD